MRPNLLKRAQSSTNRQGPLSHLLHSRANSPHPQADTVSGLKAIEEETLPKYNADSFYPARLGEVLNDRYKVVLKLGFGMTATVWLAQDIRANAKAGQPTYVTVKINVNTLTNDFLSGRREIAERLQTANPNHPGYKHVRFMLDTFRIKSKHGEHLCIVYDVLREPIDLCMEKFPGRRFNSEKLRKLLPALLLGLDYMHSECRVVHTDLKADNIMMGLGDPSVLERFVQRELEHPSPRKMPDNHGRIIYTSCSDFGEAPSDAVIESAKITDIGLAQWGDVRNTKPIQSNAFMAPEVILQCGWSYPADIWNLGVMLWDLFENFGLFDGIDTRPGHYRPEQHLGLMISLLGPPPKEFLKRGAKTTSYFDAQGQLKNAECLSEDLTFESSISRLRGEEKELFIDFAKKMLKWVPEERWTAEQLLEHPYLTKEREYIPTPALSRTSTETFGSILPSRTGTPGPTSSPLSASLHLPKDVEKSASRNSPTESTDTSLENTTSVPSTYNTTTLPYQLKKRDTSLSESSKPPVPQSNKCSQELIDSILNRGKANANKAAETK
ncbi:CMGC/SRPK protein kinase [Capronia epimyces CBS 606.96]|uniref:non-specific serine/threonine protein kinase n=1 Tax=Capronia epimyces CBS 606.96 TaxID=1182542 RepID=W9YAB3_9EURO|nr:CMGC/SRPK protein kinase [Capronia epimyces CBS 606.96]EXJ79314.1 CMGC/SRPK protein kinase [Capronia epimyces CBS 606.96]